MLSRRRRQACAQGLRGGRVARTLLPPSPASRGREAAARRATDECVAMNKAYTIAIAAYELMVFSSASFRLPSWNAATVMSQPP